MLRVTIVVLQIHDILGGDKQLVQELLHDMKQEAASQKHAAAAAAGAPPAAAVPLARTGVSHARSHASLQFCKHSQSVPECKCRHCELRGSRYEHTMSELRGVIAGSAQGVLQQAAQGARRPSRLQLETFSHSSPHGDCSFAQLIQSLHQTLNRVLARVLSAMHTLMKNSFTGAAKVLSIVRNAGAVTGW